jgi:carbamoyl-phosphate synthase small subunit
MARMTALIALEDGLVLEAKSVGAPGTRLGEMAFTTSMTGYQEAVTDPSYLGQLLVFAAPMIGNYGAGPNQDESDRPWPGAVIMRASDNSSGTGGKTGWNDWLSDRDVVAVEGADTRLLVRRLRDGGAMRGGVSTELPADELLARIRSHPELDGRDLTSAASGTRRTMGEAGPVIAVIDCGMKHSIAAGLVAAGCRLEAFPAGASADDIRAISPDGVFVSNGPGDPAAVIAVIDALRDLMRDGPPMFGICMGHQLIAQALGMSTHKLPFGHRGANHPVRRTNDGKVEITVQNHGYAVSADPLPEGVEITRESLFDGSVEGLAAPELKVRSVQYHPEARPGPRDATYLFESFVKEIS